MDLACIVHRLSRCWPAVSTHWLRDAKHSTVGRLEPSEYADEDEGQLDAVSKWLDERVLAPCDADKVARVVMRCVLRAGVGADDPPSASKICRTIKCCAKVFCGEPWAAL